MPRATMSESVSVSCLSGSRAYLQNKSELRQILGPRRLRRGSVLFIRPALQYVV